MPPVEIIETHGNLAKVRHPDGRLELVTLARLDRLLNPPPEPPRPAPPPSPPEVLTVGQAARMLGVTAKTVGRWVDSGRLAGAKTVGGHRRVLTASVIVLIGQTRRGRRPRTA